MLPFEKLKKEVYKISKRLGFVGGELIFHPKRKNKEGEWFVSPHFHGLIYGWHRGFYIRGWVVKNHGVRRTEKEQYTTIRYQLSHAGVHLSKHTVVWFGSLSYNKLKVMPYEKPKHLCPVCGMELKPMIWVGRDKAPPPLDRYEWDSADWIYAMPDWRKKLRDESEGFRMPSIDYRFCLVMPSKLVSKPIVQHTYEALRKANPLMPDWMINLFLGE